MSVSESIKRNPALKRIVHRMLLPKGMAKPRLWVRLFLNRFFHKYGKGSIIRRRTRMDLLPFNKFEMGAKSIIDDFSTINNGVGNVLIGDNSRIGIGDVIIGPVTIGKNVIFAQNIVASGLNHDYRNPDLPIMQQKIITALITVEDDCWIGANVVIVAGVTIGKHCIIAAGSVVTKNIPSFSVAAGNPAKVIKYFDETLKEWKKVKT